MKKDDDIRKVIHLNQLKPAMMSKNSRTANRAKDHQPRIMAITSGKGGVGKTNIVANLGYSLARYGKKILIFDADLGLGNLDVLLGIAPQYNLSHVLNGEKSLADVVVEGPGNLKILPAASGIQELTCLNPQERHNVFSQLEAYVSKFDIVLIDTAAGISSNVLYFNVNADEILVVATPEPTSMTDAYALMKVLSVKYGTSHFKLIVNAVSSEREAGEVYNQLSLVAGRFLEISIDYYGSILLDENVRKGVRQQKVVSEIAPLANASRSFSALARRIVNSPAPERGNRALKWRLTDMPN
jgi:flagellar biosynthesis protein FlhG